MANIFQMNLFNGESVCFEFKSIIICNNNIKEALLAGNVEIEAPTPYIIITNNNLSDEEINILEDASIADCLSYMKIQPSFGGILT